MKKHLWTVQGAQTSKTHWCTSTKEVGRAQQYHRFYILCKFGFEGGDGDPCLYTHRSKKGIVFIAIYVDSEILVRKGASINETLKSLHKAECNLKIDNTRVPLIQYSFFKTRKWSMARPSTLKSKLKLEYKIQMTGEKTMNAQDVRCTRLWFI